MWQSVGLMLLFSAVGHMRGSDDDVSDCFLCLPSCRCISLFSRCQPLIILGSRGKSDTSLCHGHQRPLTILLTIRKTPTNQAARSAAVRVTCVSLEISEEKAAKREIGFLRRKIRSNDRMRKRDTNFPPIVSLQYTVLYSWIGFGIRIIDRMMNEVACRPAGKRGARVS